ncbi:glycosyltransferase family 2 protein, partial [Campylobacter jejuni]|nr:glycosyltransferase family 2 protein [Campylobacter jejuni]
SVSAKRIIKESLEYRIGYVCKNIRNFTKCFNLLKNANQKSNYDLTACTDYQESLKLKNHLNFILGKNIIMIYNKIERLFILLYPLIFTYSYCEFIFKKKYKLIANNLNKIDNISFAKINDLLKMVEI